MTDEERAREFLHHQLHGWGDDCPSTEEDVPIVVALIRQVRAEAFEEAADHDLRITDADSGERMDVVETRTLRALAAKAREGAR